MRVAHYSPLPPERSGIADYSALLLPALRRRLDVTVVRRGRRRAPRGTDLALYHVGNNPEAHGWIVEALRARPGVVVLHEWVLHHLVAGLTLGRRDVATYLAAMERDGGLVGRLLGLGVVDGCVPPLWEHHPEDFPLAGLILDATADTGVIVHSRYVEARARASGYAGPIWHVPHPAWPAPEARRERLFGRGPVIGSLGFLNETKRIPQLVEAFRRVHARLPEARLLLVGAAAPRIELDERLAGLEGAVIREGHVDERRFVELMAACDVCVSLRAPTMGETSGSAVRALSLGVPLVVSDVGWFSELPDDVALKVPVDEHEVDVLERALELLAGDPDVRSAMRDAALEYAAREHDLDRVADLYAAALEQAAGGPAVDTRVAAEIAEAAAAVGIAPASAESAELADRLRDLRVG